jgi:chitodextrinase
MRTATARARRPVVVLAAAVLITALMPRSADAMVTTPIPSAPPLVPPPIAAMSPAGAQQPPAALIADPITPEATCGQWAVQTLYGGAWPTDQSWWEFSCRHSTGPCVGPGMCNADLHSNDHVTTIDYFVHDGSTAVFYGESLDFYQYVDFEGTTQCNLWWDQAAVQWYVAPDPMCGYAPQPPPPPNEAPVAVANVHCSSLYCGFDGRGSWDSDGGIAGYSWSFGDGASSLLFEGVHRYASPGTYRVSLTVTDDDGATSVDTVDAVAPNLRPVATIGYDCSGLDCRYDGGASSDPDGTVVGYRWTFGDAAGAMGRSGLHRYSSLGTYTLTLEVADDAGGLGATSTSVALIGLQAKATKVRGAPAVELTWTGAAEAGFLVYRDGVHAATVTGTSFTDPMPRGPRGTVTYKVCREGGPICSAAVTLAI